MWWYLIKIVINAVVASYLHPAISSHYDAKCQPVVLMGVLALTMASTSQFVVAISTMRRREMEFAFELLYAVLVVGAVYSFRTANCGSGPFGMQLRSWRRAVPVTLPFDPPRVASDALVS